MTTITGTAAGGLADTQECMDFCAKNNIEPDTELGGDSTQIPDCITVVTKSEMAIFHYSIN